MLKGFKFNILKMIGIMVCLEYIKLLDMVRTPHEITETNITIFEDSDMQYFFLNSSNSLVRCCKTNVSQVMEIK